MDDLISRQDAIDAMIMLGVKKAVAVLESLPSAEPERKKGEWVYDGIRGRFLACKCSICGHYENADWALLQGANYCPNCGAEMRGE